MLKTETSILNLTIEGNNHSETIILLHGGPGVPDYLAEVSNILSKTYRTVRFDQRGTGKSNSLNNSYTVDEYLYDIDQIIKYLDIDKVHIFGHSWGGLLAQLWASKNKSRVESLFLCSPSSGTGEVWKKMEKEVMKYNKKQASSKEWLVIGVNSLRGLIGSNKGYKNIFKLLWKFYFKKPNEAVEVDPSWLSGINATAINKTRKNIVSLNNATLDEALRDFSKPVTVLFGSYDIYGESQEFIKNRFPNSIHMILENSGHLPWVQDSANFKKLLNQFYALS